MSDKSGSGMSTSEKHTLAGLLVSLPVTWIFMEYVFVPIGLGSWWVYVLAYLFGAGVLINTLNKNKAYENLANQNK